MMKLVQQILAALMMTAVISTGALAQGKGQDKQRPKKETVRVIDGKGGNKPPPQQPKPPKQDGDRKKKP